MKKPCRPGKMARPFLTERYNKRFCTGLLGENGEANPRWISETRNFTGDYSLRDSVRCTKGFLALVRPELQAAMVRDSVDVEEHIGRVPDAWIADRGADAQAGSSTGVLFVEADLKSLPGIDRDRHAGTVPKELRRAKRRPLTRGPPFPRQTSSARQARHRRRRGRTRNRRHLCDGLTR